MADSLKLVVGGPSVVYVVAFGLVSVLAQVFLEYKRYVAILKWLTLVLFAYVIALFVVHVSWLEALKGLLIPKIEWNGTFLTTLVAVLGTTISPYLFVWQSSQEAEDQRIDPKKRPLKEKCRNEATRDTADPDRYDGRHGDVEHHRDFDHHDHGGHIARQGRHQYPVVVAGGGSPQADRRRVRRNHIRARHHWHRSARDTGASGIDSLCDWRGSQMASRPVAKTQAGRRVLLCVGAVRRLGRRAQLHTGRSDKGAVLECCDQRCPGGARYGHAHAFSQEQESHGRPGHPWLALRARVRFDRRHGLLHRRDVGQFVHVLVGFDSTGGAAIGAKRPPEDWARKLMLR
jgi:Natural resistance-associated macrophage protein